MGGEGGKGAGGIVLRGDIVSEMASLRLRALERSYGQGLMPLPPLPPLPHYVLGVDMAINRRDLNMTRKRYVELTKIASELCDWLERQKVEMAERCVLREIVERMPADK